MLNMYRLPPAVGVYQHMPLSGPEVKFKSVESAARVMMYSRGKDESKAKYVKSLSMFVQVGGPVSVLGSW